jgi:hypothetical protein
MRITERVEIIVLSREGDVHVERSDGEMAGRSFPIGALRSKAAS